MWPSGAEAEMDEIERCRKVAGVATRSSVEVCFVDRHRVHRGQRERCLELRQVPVFMAGWRDALVDLVHARLGPRDLLSGYVPEQLGPAAESDRGRAGAQALSDQLCNAPHRRGSVGVHFEWKGHVRFSACPPNSARSAESNRFAKSASPRDVKRE